MIDFKNITYQYGDTKAVDDFSYQVKNGSIVSLIGQSGCGKTTLINIAAKILLPTKGEVRISNKIALIPQGFSLLPWKSVENNIAIGLTIQNINKKEISDTTKKMMKALDIYHLKDNYPNFLSGGEKRRVAIARALILNPDVILMDEPFSGLDQISREKAQNLLLKIHKQYASTILLSTHSIEEASFLSDEIVIMKKSKLFKTIINQDVKENDYRISAKFHQMNVVLRNFLKESIVDEKA